MPRIRPCQNQADCKGFAMDGDHLCQYCRQVADEYRRDKQIERKLAQLERKPRRPSEVR
jgi:hypothetical protein